MTQSREEIVSRDEEINEGIEISDDSDDFERRQTTKGYRSTILLESEVRIDQECREEARVL